VTSKLADVDALIMPTVPVVPPAIDPLIRDDQHYGKTNMLVLRNCSVINFLDGCALSLPCHAQGEAPVGFMLASVGGNDQRLLSMGMAVERVLKQAS
jgi:aspartyl-tRNA(Asn)/glutamyl-tRNA(Gln) amidotransferase subunit A